MTNTLREYRNMDRLSVMATEAKKAGLSYGMYVAAVYDGRITPPAFEEPPKPTPKHISQCRFCGKDFVPAHGGLRYCSDDCRVKAALARKVRGK